jgi:hypothetical protein
LEGGETFLYALSSESRFSLDHSTFQEREGERKRKEKEKKKYQELIK